MGDEGGDGGMGSNLMVGLGRGVFPGRNVTVEDGGDGMSVQEDQQGVADHVQHDVCQHPRP